MRIIQLHNEYSYEFITKEYVAEYISTIAGLSGFTVKPKWTKAYLGVNEIKNFDKQFKEYLPELPVRVLIWYSIEARSAETLRQGLGFTILDLFSHKVYVQNNFI